MRSISVAVVLGALAISSSLNAQGLPKGTFVSSGAVVAYRQQLDGAESDGFLLGAETSLVEFEDSLLWYGAYLDGVYDFGVEATTFSVGPEVGYGPVGIDGGYLMMLSGEAVRHGVVIRPMLTIGLLTPYFRAGLLASGPEQSFAEFGMLLKFPVSYNN